MHITVHSKIVINDIRTKLKGHRTSMSQNEKKKDEEIITFALVN